jgi:hypothetical protein
MSLGNPGREPVDLIVGPRRFSARPGKPGISRLQGDLEACAEPPAKTIAH